MPLVEQPFVPQAGHGPAFSSVASGGVRLVKPGPSGRLRRGLTSLVWSGGG